MSRSVARAFIVLIAALAALAPVALAQVVSPMPGEVYREFTLVMTNVSQTWRVTDPNATAGGAQDELPNPVLNLPIPAGQLAGAIRAELLIDYWGGHPGTVGARFRFNSNAWLSLPQLTTTPPPATGNNRPECFMQQWNPVVSVPVAHLQEGANDLEGTSSGQTCFNFGWGQWGWYAVKLRVYFDPAQVSGPTGQITSPVSGATIGENPTIQLSASGGGGIDRVELLAYVEAYDWDGDGNYLDWAQSYHRAKAVNDLPISHHVGTDTSAPFALTFDTELIPDQAPGAVRFGARIKGNNGLWYVTPTVQNITLTRSGSVILVKPEDVLSRFWVRQPRPSLSSKVNIPAVDLADVSSAKLLVRTWNGVDGGGPGNHATTVNGWQIPVIYGENHHYSGDILDVDPSILVNGENTITFSSTSSHHGIEVLWPGPALLLRSSSAVVGMCGDGTVDLGEQCDDGNTTDGDGCESDCTLSVIGSPLPALYPFSGSGGTIEDASGNGNDGVLENGAARDANGRFGGALRFNGNAGNVDLGALNVVGQAGTWAAFIKADDFGVSDARILSKATSVAEPDHYFMLSTVRVASGSRHLRFRLKTGINTTTLIGTGGTISAGVWIHAAATYDGVEIRLYQDGVLVGSVPAGGSITGNPDVAVWIGNHVGGGKSFDGLIDEVLIDDRVYSEQEIVALTTGTVEPSTVCGDGTVEDGEECDDGNMDAGDGCQPDCELPICGDGFVDPGEECDDGNQIDGDGCQDGCLSPWCGDGIPDPNEECDDGNTTDGDGCQADCLLPVCGDGILDPNEECDDGNTTDGDGCQANCMAPACGDGIQDTGEECDDGNTTDGDGCQADCMNPFCGDGIQDAGEQCDDGNNVNGDGCETDCSTSPGCGDGTVGAGEQCDDGNNVNGDGCQANCMNPVCGDGIRDPGETCDDGNNLPGDGCDAACQTEAGGDVLFFFNGEGCADPVCSNTNGYTLDPVREFSAGDTTAEFVSLGTVSNAASLFGTHGFSSPSVYSQMKYSVVDGDIVDSDAGTVCAVYRRTGAAAANHRLFMIQAPGRSSFISLVYKTADDLKFVYRDRNRATTALSSVPWGGAAAAGIRLAQVSYDSAASSGALRLIVNGAEVASLGSSVNPLGTINELIVGNPTGHAGSHQFDQFLVSRDPGLDCWNLLAGTCSATASIRCVDDAQCPGAETCSGVVEDYNSPPPTGDDECPDDPNKTEPGLCGCGVPDDNADLDGDGLEDCNDDCLDGDGDGYGAAGGAGNSCLGPDCDDADDAVHPGAAEAACDGVDNDCDAGTPDCAGDSPEILFFFNGEGCADPVCDSGTGYTLDPVREYSAGDTTAELLFGGAVNQSASLYGTHGFDAPAPYSQMKYDVVDGDLVDRDAGSVCTVYRRTSAAAAAHRLFILQAPGRQSFISLVYKSTNDLKFVHRDLNRTTRTISSQPWGGAASVDPLLVQVSYDSTASSGALKLIVDGVERASLDISVNPLGAINHLIVGNPTGNAGGHHFDQFLVSPRPDLDCWDLIAGTCVADSQVRCIDASDCPSNGTCSGVAEDFGQLN